MAGCHGDLVANDREIESWFPGVTLSMTFQYSIKIYFTIKVEKKCKREKKFVHNRNVFKCILTKFEETFAGRFNPKVHKNLHPESRSAQSWRSRPRVVSFPQILFRNPNPGMKT